MFGNLGALEITLIILIILILFGGKKIPELIQGIGKGLKEFKKSVKEEDDNDSNSNDVKKNTDKK